MAELSIVDAHVHLWEQPQFPRPWLMALPTLNRPFGLAEYRHQTDGMPITGMVYVESAVAPSYALLEAQWAVKLAEVDPRLCGVVAAAPLEDGLEARPYLEALATLGPLVKGVRRNVQDEPNPDFCQQRAFVAGVGMLAAYGFSFDICIRHEQLPAVTELVRECPAVSFVLDHFGKPAIQEGNPANASWYDQLAALAAFPNVACKLSGLVTEANWHLWQPEDLDPYVAHALDVFGPQRVLFGGDWPVVTLASPYRRWVETLAGLTSHLSAPDQRLLWGENAQRWYRLA